MKVDIEHSGSVNRIVLIDDAGQVSGVAETKSDCLTDLWVSAEARSRCLQSTLALAATTLGAVVASPRDDEMRSLLAGLGWSSSDDVHWRRSVSVPAAIG